MSTSIDNRPDYYARAADLIAADPLDFYCRAERGRQIQARFPWIRTEPVPVAEAVVPEPLPANVRVMVRKVAR